MLESNQTSMQALIQVTVTNGLGFLKTSYLSKNNVYKKFLCEEEVKNTKAGLQAHLAEMNFDRFLKKYFDYRREGFFGRLKSGFYYAGLNLKIQNLKDKAAEEAIKKRGGLCKVIIQGKLIQENVIHYMTFDSK